MASEAEMTFYKFFYKQLRPSAAVAIWKTIRDNEFFFRVMTGI